MIEVAAESVHSEDATELLRQAVEELQRRYPFFAASEYTPAEADGAGAGFLIARINGQAVGCGALRPFEPGVAEIKRMFVQEAFRRKGISKAMLQALEQHARVLGYQRIVLETGIRQPEAITLYQTNGYEPIDNYGYQGEDSLSVCFGKNL
ncbi:MAG: GNAT family N-acetyltransferase [Siphonobacter sp.]